MTTTPEPVSAQAPALRGRVLMNQDWRDLTYLHWAVDPGRVAPLMPPGVRPDVHDGATYVGLVPFRMVDAGPGRRSTVPWLGTFLETNVRVYSVDEQGRRGVVFLSLDADRLAVAVGARTVFNVPYRWAAMSHHRDGALHTYRARLRSRARTRSEIVVRVGEPRPATALDDFLSARWRLHTRRGRRTIFVPNRHEPWPLHDATLEHLDDSLLGVAGFADLTDRAPDHVAFSPGVHTEFGFPQRA